MGFFEKFSPKNFKEDKKIDKHVDFALIEKEPSLDDYISALNNAADVERFTEDSKLSKKPEDTKNSIWGKIKELNEKLEELQYDNNNQDPILRDKIKSFSERLERLHNNLENTRELTMRENIYAQILNTSQSLSRLVEKQDNNSEDLKKKIDELTDTLISIETIPTSNPDLN